MKQSKLSRRVRAGIAAVTTVAIIAPVTAVAMVGEPSGDSAKQLPEHLQNFKSPLSKAKTDKLIAKGKAKYGPGKKKLPRFKKGLSKKKRTQAIGAMNRTVKAVKADAKTPVAIKDAVAVWEAMNPDQKNEVLAETDAVVAAWPAAVAATAAAVTAAVAVADFAYKVYVDQRDNGGDDDEEETETEDGGDTSDTGIIRGALTY